MRSLRARLLLYEDADILVINKPAGLLCHPVGHVLSGTLVDMLRVWFGPLVRLVHRLDRETSGVVVAARTARAWPSLYQQFAQRQVRKQYWGIVYGCPAPLTGKLEFPIGPAPQTLIKIKMGVVADGRPACTCYRVLARAQEISFLELEPLTGRKHQIRVHLAAMGHPLVGDRLYSHGGLPFLKEYYLQQTFQPPAGKWLPRQALHACSLQFQHPVNQTPLCFRVPLPADMQHLLRKVGL